MNFLISVVGAMLGILLAIGIVVFIIYLKIKSAVGSANMRELKSVMKNAGDIQKNEYNREKSVKGMTRLLEEEIIRDFPDFNKDIIFSTCQSNLTKIFNCLEERSSSKINNDDNFTYMKDFISEQIEDMKSNDIYEKYDDITFNRHAISSYEKKQGTATIKISTTLSYYYNTNRKDKKSFPDVKKQTRYTSEFVYIYDESKIGNDILSFTVHCPNCGAPLRHLRNNQCEYCSSYVEKIDYKIWKMSSYKEDYK